LASIKIPGQAKSLGQTRRRLAIAAILLPSVALALAGCKPDEKAEAPVIRPVRTITAAKSQVGEPVQLTGHVQAEKETALAFRIAGRIIERKVNVGDRVQPDQVLARLDPQNELNALRSAQAALAAAEAQLVQNRNTFSRQQTLLARGFTTKVLYDQAQQALTTSQSQVDDARAQLQVAQDRVSYTELKANVTGSVTARNAESGEVVQAGQAVFVVAREDGRDAVFDVPAPVLRAASSDPHILVSLTDDPQVKVEGRVRQVDPQADPVTRTFRVRVSLINPPASMLLGATVNGRMEVESDHAISIPASALTNFNRQPAVWLVDPASQTVSLHNVEVSRFDPGTVVISEGLEGGEIVVTAGVQALHPGQKVRLLGSPT